MNAQVIPRSVGTHDGSFHADEVTACALLVVTNLVDEDKVVRTRDPEVLSKCDFVCDVGGVYNPEKHLFDHHQSSYTGPLSSAGMVLQYLKDKKKLTEDEYMMLHMTLIHGVDAHDNGIELQPPGVCTYSQLISNYMPIRHDSTPEILDAAFMEALRFAVGHLKRQLERHRYIHGFKQIVQRKMQEGRDVLVFDEPIPWMDCFFESEGEMHPAVFIIMPSGSHWKLRGIPPNSREKMKVRMPLPLKWAGLLNDELKKASGIPGAIFCHKGRFFSLWETKEDAIKALDIVLKSKGR